MRLMRRACLAFVFVLAGCASAAPTTDPLLQRHFANSPTRSLQEIQIAFDQNKAIFYRDIARAHFVDSRRIVLSITIDPDGKVTDCHVVSTNFDNSKVVDNIVDDVRQIKFAARDVPTYTYPAYPILYFPRSADTQ